MNTSASPMYVGELNGTCLGDLRLAASDLGLVAIEWADSQVHFDNYLRRLKRSLQPNTRKLAPYARELSEYLTSRFPESSWKELSMGMSGDFEEAIAEGATIIRVGSTLFTGLNQ